MTRRRGGGERGRRGRPTPHDPLEPLRTPGFLSELRRKAIHISFLVMPLAMLHGWLPWPRSTAEWRWVLIVAVVLAVAIDLVRVHDRRVKQVFKRFFGEMIREHEELNLLGSTYLLLASLLAIEIFPQPIAAAAIGFTVLGDGVAAIAGKAFGRTRLFRKSLEGGLGGLMACLVWAAYLVSGGHLPLHVAVSGALAASLVELLPIPLDDNLGITLAAGYAMKLLVGTA